MTWTEVVTRRDAELDALYVAGSGSRWHPKRVSDSVNFLRFTS